MIREQDIKYDSSGSRCNVPIGEYQWSQLYRNNKRFVYYKLSIRVDELYRFYGKYLFHWGNGIVNRGND